MLKSSTPETDSSRRGSMVTFLTSETLQNSVSKETDHGSTAMINTMASNPEGIIEKPSLDTLEGLRGIGSICILIYHFLSGFAPMADDISLYPIYAPELTSVVTLFFVISGFTLACVYDSPPPVLSFIKKRIARLFPIYYLSLLPALPSFYVYTKTPALTASTSLLMLQSLIVPNEGWNLPLWQVSAFAFTYPFFPFIFGRLQKWSTHALRISLIWLMVCNVIAVVVVMQILPLLGLSVGILHRWAPFRLPQFFAGIATGILAQRKDIVNATLKGDSITILLTVSALILCPLAVRASPLFLGVPMWDFYDTVAEYVVTPLHCLWLLALSSKDCNSYTKRIMVSPPLKFLGEISYSFYCFHAPILYLAAWTVKNKGVNSEALPLLLEPSTGIYAYFAFPWWAIFPLIIIIIFVASIVNSYIEKPSRRWLNKVL